MIMKREVSYFMKLACFTVIMAMAVPAALLAQKGKVSFAGTWTLNEQKSTQQGSGGYQRMGGGSFVIAQEENLLTRTRTAQDGTTRVSKYTLDGKESVNTTGRGESKSTAKWSQDGKTLTIVSKFTVEGKERTSTETWSLADPKTLSIAVTRQGPDGEIKSTMVYDKK
jgi:Tol biopolymer transport system component